MTDMFSNQWMKGFMDAWNSEPDLSGELEKIGFNSVIAYGIDGEDQPRGYIKIENGHAVDLSTPYQSRTQETQSLLPPRFPESFCMN